MEPTIKCIDFLRETGNIVRIGVIMQALGIEEYYKWDRVEAFFVCIYTFLLKLHFLYALCETKVY